MTPSHAASMIFGIMALLFAFIVWFGLYRSVRADILRERLEAIRDNAFDATLHESLSFQDPSWQATVAWLESTARQADVLNGSRFVLALLFAAPGGQALAGDAVHLLEPYTGEAIALVRRHLILGCPALALLPRKFVTRGVLQAMIDSGTVTARSIVKSTQAT